MVEAGAASAPAFFVVSVTVTLLPALAEDGAAQALTVRSVPMRMLTRRVLLDSSLSSTVPARSALATM